MPRCLASAVLSDLSLCNAELCYGDGLAPKVSGLEETKKKIL